jgi:sugar O-acyltransferase (sialic acid O-acetyltransferase NeuD family)
MPQKPVAIFGTASYSDLAWYCLRHDSDRALACFTVDSKYLKTDSHHGLPVVAFESLEKTHPPGSTNLIIPIGYHRQNSVRRDRYLDAKKRGYELISYVSGRASTWPDLVLGENCLIYEHAIVQPFVRIGHDTIVRSGAHLSYRCELGAHVYIGAAVALAGNVQVGDQCTVGVGAVIKDGVKLAECTMVAPGAVLLENTERGGLYVGNPARKVSLDAPEARGLAAYWEDTEPPIP